MKKLVGGLAALVVLAGILFFAWQKFGGPKSEETKPTLNVSGLKGPANDEVALYDVSITTSQRSAARNGVAMSVKGTLAQSRQGDKDFITEWRDISEFMIGDNSADAGLIASLRNKPIITVNNRGSLEHFLPKDFPPSLLTFQLSFMNKLFVPVFGNSNNPIQSTEKDEVGTAKIQYDFMEEGQNIKVLKTFDRYVQDGVKIDAEDNFLSFAYTLEQRLIQVKGKLTAHFREPVAIHLTTDIKVEYKGPAPKLELASANPDKSTMTKTDIHRAAAIAQDMAKSSDAMSYEEAMKKIDTITEATEGKEVYEIFMTLKSDLSANPEHGAAVVQKISEIKDRSEAGQRKLALMFGALAQSNAPEHADALAKLASDCPDEFCKTQAMVGLNDHGSPTPESAQKMLAIATQSNDADLSGTALLAAGSVAKKLQEAQSVTSELLSEVKDPAKADQKNTIIAAMGNHGAADYFSTLNENLKSKNVSTRSTAAYSMRYLPNSEVNGVLIGLMKDPELDVQREAVKAMAYRNLSLEEYQSVAKSAAQNPDRDLQQEAARVLVAAYRDNPNTNLSALETLKNESKNPEIKSFITEEMKAIQSAAEDRAQVQP